MNKDSYIEGWKAGIMYARYVLMIAASVEEAYERLSKELKKA